MDDIEHERRWTAFAMTCLAIVFCLGAIGFGYVAIFMWVLEGIDRRSGLLAHALAVPILLCCILPGIVVWRRLRPRNRFAALVGLAVAAVVSIDVPWAIGAPLGVSPDVQAFTTVLFQGAWPSGNGASCPTTVVRGPAAFRQTGARRNVIVLDRIPVPAIPTPARSE